MNGRFPRGQRRHVGSGPPCGASCGIRRIRAKHASAKQSCVRVNASRAPYQRNRLPTRNSANHERARRDWIEIPVPALVSEDRFALAQEQLQNNKHHSPRRTIEPTLLQGILVCQRCGYALYRSSTVTSKRRLYYYRCIGSDAFRRLKGPVCSNRPIRQDYLDEFVWKEIIRLLDEPALIQAEIQRRMEAARNADPLRKREQALRHQQVGLQNHIDRMVTAYQEELITLAELRQRVPNLRKQELCGRVGTPIPENGIGRSVQILATCRDVIGVSWQITRPCRNSRHRRAAEDPPSGCARNPGR